jgi:hypothetical protein
MSILISKHQKKEKKNVANDVKTLVGKSPKDKEAKHLVVLTELLEPSNKLLLVLQLSVLQGVVRREREKGVSLGGRDV